jgi:pilus assembly protein CpaB
MNPSVMRTAPSTLTVQSPAKPGRRAALVAAVSGLLGGGLVWAYLGRLEQEIAGGPPEAVLVVREAIERGDVLLDERLAVREIPADYVDARQVKSGDRNRVTGLRIRTALEPEQTLLWTDLDVYADEQRDLSELIPDGHRAVSIRPSRGDASLGLVRPGDFVDVVANLQRAGSGEPAAVVLLQNVLVLAVGRQFVRGTQDLAAETGADDASVTLSVSLRQAQLVSLASEEGRLSLALRNPSDQRTAPDVPEVLASALTDAEVRARAQRSETGPIRLEAENP